MNTLILNPKDNDILVLDKKDTNYQINVLENTHIKIYEYDIDNSNVSLNAGVYAHISYDVINLTSVNIIRKLFLKKYAEIKMNTINLSVLKDSSNVELQGEGAWFEMNNLAIICNGNQLMKTHVLHNSVKGHSKIYNIGVAIENADILFDTTGEVVKGEELNDCRQLSKGIIIGENAKITERPILLIDNYNVSAYHGASIGKMSEEQLFYLMSRGIPKKEAFMLILNGLIAPFIENVDESKKQETSLQIEALLEEAK